MPHKKGHKIEGHVAAADGTRVKTPVIPEVIENYIPPRDFGEIKPYEEPSTWEWALNKLANPLTAFGYSVRGQDMPDMVKRVDNPFDMALGLINPFSWIEAASDVPQNLKDEEYGTAALNVLGVVPSVSQYKNIAKLSKEAAKTGKKVVNKVGETVKKAKETVEDIGSNIPVTKTQRKTLEAAQDKAHEEGMDFMERYLYTDDLGRPIDHLNPTIQKKIDDIVGVQPAPGVVSNTSKRVKNNPMTNTSNRLIPADLADATKLFEKGKIPFEEYENMFKANNRKGVAGVNISLGSNDPRFPSSAPNMSLTKRKELGKDARPKTWVRSYLSPYFSPYRVKGTAVHEAGHTMQKFGAAPSPEAPFRSIQSMLTTPSKEFNYNIANKNTQIGRDFADALVTPTKQTRGSSIDTWLASPTELHSELLRGKSAYYDKLVKNGVNPRTAMFRVRNLQGKDMERMINSSVTSKHFKPSTDYGTRDWLLNKLPAVVPAVGVGVGATKGEDTPKFEDGGSIDNDTKKLRKRKVGNSVVKYKEQSDGTYRVKTTTKVPAGGGHGAYRKRNTTTISAEEYNALQDRINTKEEENANRLAEREANRIAENEAKRNAYEAEKAERNAARLDNRNNPTTSSKSRINLSPDYESDAYKNQFTAQTTEVQPTPPTLSSGEGITNISDDADLQSLYGGLINNDPINPIGTPGAAPSLDANEDIAQGTITNRGIVTNVQYTDNEDGTRTKRFTIKNPDHAVRNTTTGNLAAEVKLQSAKNTLNFSDGGQVEPPSELDKFKAYLRDQEAGIQYMKAKPSGILKPDGTKYRAYENGRFYPYFVEGETYPTIGYGRHAKNLIRDFSDGITEEQANAFLDEDIASHLQESADYWDGRFGEGEFAKLDESTQYMLTDLTYNIGNLEEFPNFSQAIYDKDTERALKEYTRAQNGVALTKRNEGFLKTYVQPWVDGVLDDRARAVETEQARRDSIDHAWENRSYIQQAWDWFNDVEKEYKNGGKVRKNTPPTNIDSNSSEYFTGWIKDRKPYVPSGVATDADPEMYFVDQYNTELNDAESEEYAIWLDVWRDPNTGNPINKMDQGAYDLQGYFKSGDWESTDKDGHGSDRWKKPNHPTFSEQSVWSAQNGGSKFEGGTWLDGGAFVPGYHNMHSNDRLLWEFDREPHRPEHLFGDGYMLPTIEITDEDMTSE